MSPTPYSFLSIDAGQAVHDTPLWRDGNSSEDRYSGELLITLNALTPLIVGNHQHKKDDKQTLVPQMMDDGRVLLAGSSLKGMLRSALSSLLHAPMAQVAEHHYTYRPNLRPPKREDRAAVVCTIKREVRAAVVRRIESDNAASPLSVALLPAHATVVFVRSDAFSRLGNVQAGSLIRRRCANVVMTDKAPRMRLELNDRATEQLNHHLFDYRGGIDGEGLFAKAFGGRIYRHVLVSVDCYANAVTIPVPYDVFCSYRNTQMILADSQSGHLSPGHPLAGKLNQAAQAAIHRNTGLQVNQLIYVEIEGGDSAPRIVSMGHHFQYRWGYTSSVRRKNRLLDGQGILRPELGLHPHEQAASDGTPQRLTGARLLFGYALDGRDNEHKALATGHFKRLAGRITFNTAIEDAAGKSLEERFVGGGSEIQLHVLGMPRPSAVEFYLKQTALQKNLLTTYGDLPNEPGGELAGRKYYRHQPDAAKDASSYSPVISGHRQAERGTCVHYLSTPGSRFRCTLRFDNLRPWELGALLATLDPKLLEPLFDIPKHEPGYAHKLGYGKPLGLGSVQLRIDGVRWRQKDEHDWRQTRSPDSDSAWTDLKSCSLASLKEKLHAAWGGKAKEHLEPWLKARRWAYEGRAFYPTAKGKENFTIFNFHTDLRRKHAAARRGANQDFIELRKLLESDS